MVLIEEYVCDNKLQLEQRERYWLEYYQPSLNTTIPCISEEERKEKNKNYYNNNKEKIKEYKKEKIECNICGKIMRRDSLIKHKKTQHKDKIEDSE
jgi:hypothetical protein